MYTFKYSFRNREYSISCDNLDLAQHAQRLVWKWFNTQGEIYQDGQLVDVHVPASRKPEIPDFVPQKLDPDYVPTEGRVVMGLPTRPKRKFYLSKAGRHELLGVVNDPLQRKPKT